MTQSALALSALAATISPGAKGIQPSTPLYPSGSDLSQVPNHKPRLQGGPAEEYSVIHSLPLFWKHYIFVQEGRARKKEEKGYVTVRVAVAK